MLVSGTRSVAALKYCAIDNSCCCFVEMPIFMHKDERLKRESTVISSMLTKTLGMALAEEKHDAMPLLSFFVEFKKKGHHACC